ncbi:MAG: hypothetical protein AAFO69_21545, partial [Bacteroidota bacterium]
YEDFDFWIRSARRFYYAYSDEVLVYKRTHQHNYSLQQRKPGNNMMQSTLKVCEKIYMLNQRASEFRALRIRILYQLKACIRYGNWSSMPGFIRLLIKTESILISMKDRSAAVEQGDK